MLFFNLIGMFLVLMVEKEAVLSYYLLLYLVGGIIIECGEMFFLIWVVRVKIVFFFFFNMS